MSKELASLNPKPNHMRNFKEFKIWQKGFDIAVDTYKLIETFPKSEKYSSLATGNKSCNFYPIKYC